MKWLIALGIVVILSIIFVAGIVAWGVGVSNQEITLRNQITAKQTDNKNQFDLMWKAQMQSFQITDKQKQMLYDVIVGNSKARATGSGSLATFVTEAVPNIDKSTDLYRELMNTVTSLRLTWARKQTEIIDYKREHDNIIDKFPSCVVCGILGRKKIDIVIVTSDRTEEAFVTGKDNNIDLQLPPIEKK